LAHGYAVRGICVILEWISSKPIANLRFPNPAIADDHEFHIFEALWILAEIIEMGTNRGEAVFVKSLR